MRGISAQNTRLMRWNKFTRSFTWKKLSCSNHQPPNDEYAIAQGGIRSSFHMGRKGCQHAHDAQLILRVCSDWRQLRMFVYSGVSPNLRRMNEQRLRESGYRASRS